MASSNKAIERRARIKRTARQQSVERNRCQEASIRTRAIGRRGEINRRLIHETKLGDYEIYLHVTKGWRKRRVEPLPNEREAA